MGTTPAERRQAYGRHVDLKHHTKRLASGHVSGQFNTCWRVDEVCNAI